ncbi:Gfo/Idh/MocA family protein [Kineococcus rubinsiae]|uniref:Gfo/Idh/MocA family protein n=1 Tax=Kineococcus rubinsiae TaxID=2609562 RepID=UPI001AD8E03B|nr:Gfo/Idh/MocA family oxidoreductase [Kineococcus rubinsiae]
MSAPAPLRAGLVGLGVMGRHHARVLNSLPGVELVCVVDAAAADPQVAQLVPAGVPVSTDVGALLAARVDLVVVAVPTALHEAVAVPLLEAGVSVLVEKPLAHTAESARRILEAAQRPGVVAAVGHIERCNPALRELRRRTARGDLGRLHQVQTRRQGPFPARIGDVGVVKDLGTHDIDLTAWITGAPYTAVSARTAHRAGRAHEDLAVVVGTLADGTIANHVVNWLSPVKERVTVVTGEGGTLVADTLTADLTLHANGSVPVSWEALAGFRGVSEGDVTRFAFPKPEPVRTELEGFRDAVRAVRDGDAPAPADAVVTAVEGLLVVEVAEAVLLSAAQGRTVDLPAPPS